MKYLIFGGSGFIGSHLIDLIKKNNPESLIYNLDIVENTNLQDVHFIFCDIRNPINIDITLSADDIIFNLAAIHRTPGHPDYEYFETNIKGAENICNFATEHTISKIVFTSSIAPYGASETLKYENTLPTPNTPYGISKLVAEKIHQIWQNSSSKNKLLIVRPGVVFGKQENGNFTRLYWGIKKKRFLYPGRRDTIKASIYVKDLVSFMLYIIENTENKYSLYNCTYEPAFTIEDIVETMSYVTHMKSPRIKLNSRLMIISSYIIGALGGKKLGIHPDRVRKLMISTNISGEKMKNSGYLFKYTLEEAIQDWFNDNNNEYLK